MARKYFVRTFGCQMNEHDSQRIASDLTLDGLERAERIEDADVVVLNTCCIRENADNKLYGTLGHVKSLRDARPDLQIAVGGCLAQKDRETILKRAPYVDVVFGTHNIGRAPALLQASRDKGHSIIEILESAKNDEAMPSALLVRPELPYAAWVTIQAGCDNSCAFCIVPSVRGKEKSRPFANLLEEVARLAKNGTTEVTLLGQNVNSYGRDVTLELRRLPPGADEVRLAGATWANESARRARPLFSDLLRAVGDIDGIDRIRFTSPHPKDLSDDTIAAMASTPAVCEQLHLPLQSGSDSVLARMRRGYTAARYKERLEKARAEIDDLAVTTDVIVGFPGETDAEFEATLEFVAEVGYDGAYTFIFSPRPGTRAASMTELFVPEAVIAERFSRLKAVVDRSSLQKNQARIGRIEDVVVEGTSRKDEGVLASRTRQGKLAHFVGRREELPPGTRVSLEIVGAGAHHLVGEPLLAQAAHTRPKSASLRRKIPVEAG